MKKDKLSQFEKIKIFLNEYYLGYGIYNSTVRIIGGPLILIYGLYLYFNSKPGVGYFEFMIVFGIYFTLKPLIIIFTKKSWFNNFDLDYEIEPEKVIISLDKSKSEIDYSDLKSVQKRKTYFALKTNSKQGIYLLLRLLEKNEIDILNNQIKIKK